MAKRKQKTIAPAERGWWVQCMEVVQGIFTPQHTAAAVVVVVVV